MNDNQVSHPVLKVASVGAALLGGMTWGEFAQMLAAIYTLCLIADFMWKRFGKPFAISRGWMRGKGRAYMDTTAHGDLE